MYFLIAIVSIIASIIGISTTDAIYADSFILFFIFIFTLPIASIIFLLLGIENLTPKVTEKNYSLRTYSRRADWLYKKEQEARGGRLDMDLTESQKLQIEKFRKEKREMTKKFGRKYRAQENTYYDELAKSEKKSEEKRKERQDIRNGPIAPEIICPHCQAKGKVRTTQTRKTEHTRQRGIIGGVLGVKTTTDKGTMTQLHCDNCDVTWNV
jgi:hypothetical protein